MEYKTKIIFILLIITACALALHFFDGSSSKPRRKIPKINPDEKYQVLTVLDGDTFEVKMNGKMEKVRMLGIDTPETVDPRKPVQCYGKEASDMTKSMLSHHSVVLKIDAKQSILDKYGRILAYVYRDDGLFINTFLLEKGYAREYTYGNAYSFQKEFKALQASAQEQKFGLWESCNDPAR